MNAYDSSNPEVNAGGLGVQNHQIRDKIRRQGQPGLHESLSQKKKKIKDNNNNNKQPPVTVGCGSLSVLWRVKQL